MLVRFKWSEALGGDAKYFKISNLIMKEFLLNQNSEYTELALKCEGSLSSRNEIRMGK